MKRKYFVWMIMVAAGLIYACKSEVRSNYDHSAEIENIKQQKDGTISLDVDNAQCYHDMVNPASNTAEWNVRVSKSGRFDVWLSSATRDTTNLQYKHSVMLSVYDNRLEARPSCDKVFLNSSDVSYPYYRADSFIGSLYIQDTGLCNIQVISEKIIPDNYRNGDSSGAEISKLLSVVLKPTTH